MRRNSDSRTWLPTGRRVISCRLLATAIGLLVLSRVGLAATPVASDISQSSTPGKTLNITLQASDADGDVLDYIIVAPLPAASLAEIVVDGATLASGDLPYTIAGHGQSFSLVLPADAHGTASIKFQADDGTNTSDEATVSVVVNRAPTAATVDTFHTLPDTEVDFDLPVEDADDDTLAYTILSLPGHGQLQAGSTTLTDDDIPYAASSAAVTYVPDPSYHGQDWFHFQATDGTANSAVIQTLLEVNTPAEAASVEATVLPGGEAEIALAGSDADKDPVLFVIASLPTHGWLVAAGGRILAEDDLPFTLDEDETTLTYRVEAGYRGVDTFHYRVQDAVSISPRAVATMTVNTPPAADEQSLAVEPGTTATGTLAPVDADGDTLTLRLVALTAHGALKIDGRAVSGLTTKFTVPAAGLAFSYTPTVGFAGSDGFIWCVSDGLEDSPEIAVAFAVQPATPVDDATDGDADDDDSATDDDGTDGDDDGGATDGDDDAAAPSCAPLGGSVVLTVAGLAGLMGRGRRKSAADLPAGPKRIV